MIRHVPSCNEFIVCWHVQFFSNLRKHRSTGLTFVLHSDKTLVENDSYSSTTTKSSFIRRSASFGNISPFSSRGNKHIFRAYPSSLKIAELCFETTAAHSTIIWSDWLGFLPLWGTGTDFVSILPLPLIYWPSRKHYIVHGNNAQDCFGITGDQLCATFNTRFEAKCKQ